MKTIVQVVQHLRPGGLEVMALELMNFSTFRHNMKIVSLEGDMESAIAAWPRLEAYKNQLIFLDKQPGLSFALVKQLRNLLSELKADVVHTHHIGPFFYGGLASRLNGIAHMHTEHDAWHYNDKRHRLLHRIVSLVANPVEVADADIVAQGMMDLPGIHQLKVIKNGIDTSRFIPGDKFKARNALNLPSGVKLIGASGRLEEVKGHSILIEAMADLPAHYHLVIAGSGSLESALKAQAERLAIDHRVHFLGHVENMPMFYQSLDLFCLPSFNEGFPLAPLEAQSCGIPTAVTDVGGAVETLCPQTGLVLKAGDPEAMAEKILPFLYESRLHTPRDFVMSHADVRKMAKAYDSLTEGLCYGV
ncbi:GDP-mannose-dependent alpha-(1-6)-phosphatidylinositol monomannoside mannosyltransferase [Grimontia celer]|uniref:GDP-mannose-dependent alpha-(1-6)-phosphatidylinositol monomannoside mannosyltransferase n=1 Tax=Grimontia celer TaxID=1796497 RepID=A0A128F4A5_9GAMM|nr:glycosyltransferase [Grimontia celer]CZF81131.1 GDP-mannose-dependent alpha-(1-6)-phosphatidylinositol monomannoside mannosyltransferase [Grimontia celer]